MSEVQAQSDWNERMENRFNNFVKENPLMETLLQFSDSFKSSDSSSSESEEDCKPEDEVKPIDLLKFDSRSQARQAAKQQNDENHSKIVHSKKLVAHPEINLKPGNLMCSYCQKIFTKKLDYHEHVKAHTDFSKLFVCEVCTLRFFSSITMEAHKATHYGKIFYDLEKFVMITFKSFLKESCARVYFSCNICQKFFKTKEQFDVHHDNHYG